ncbi:hypothetical protein O181_015596 [Austropuccinia psidii MF-1]|uniref:Copper-fist domain-containing protein n=1 Tax=Austropuccinia psidii MF-1 TaxID=1389203 RepID=A0A9Q3C420_9BASI|nr:hypothetical protein [Austropuccinia psidii MF-1]
MVIIDGKKFACGACIKGHRSTSCNHTNRTLVEIGKKGRPPTQCNHCRELRKINKVHTKCVCGDKPIKSTRTPIILPNGITSLIESEPLATTKTKKQSSDKSDLAQQIFNPCLCTIGGTCCCCSQSSNSKSSLQTNASNSTASTPSSNRFPNPSSSPSISNTHSEVNFSTRQSCCSNAPPVSQQVQNIVPGSSRSLQTIQSNNFQPYRYPSPSPTLTSSSPPALFFKSDSTESLSSGSQSNHQLPPSNLETSSALFAPQTAGTALCFCGIHCPCPGCVLHDPLGLKFYKDSGLTACPTSAAGEGCIAGIDLPTVNVLLNLTPIGQTSEHSSTSSASTSSSGQIQLPSVSETFGLAGFDPTNFQSFTTPNEPSPLQPHQQTQEQKQHQQFAQESSSFKSQSFIQSEPIITDSVLPSAKVNSAYPIALKDTLER